MLIYFSVPLSAIYYILGVEKHNIFFFKENSETPYTLFIFSKEKDFTLGYIFFNFRIIFKDTYHSQKE